MADANPAALFPGAPPDAVAPPGDIAPGIVAPLAEVWSENPLIGNSNPGTKAGQSIFYKINKGFTCGLTSHCNEEGCSSYPSFLAGLNLQLWEKW